MPAPSPPPAPPEPEAFQPAAAAPEPPSPALPSAGTEAVPAATPARAGEAAQRVAAYLARVEHIQSAGAGSSQDVAQRILGALLQGDTTAFDELLVDTERVERELATIAAPRECAGYHAALLASLADSRALLAELRAALTAEDSDRLQALAAKASALQQRVESVQAEERELRRRWGL